MRPRAFVAGNVCWDETLRVSALPTPGASIHFRAGPEGLGGKGANQAAALARSGAPTTLIAAVGDDARGAAARAILAAEGLADGLIVRRGVATDRSAILVPDTGENAVLTTRAAAETVSPADLRAALAPARPGDLLLLQGNLTLEATRAAFAEGAARGMARAFNPSPLDTAFAPLCDGLDVLFVNRGEAEALAGVVAPDALRALGARLVVLTLGAEGALLIGSQDVATVPAAQVAAVDPTGAGDALTGVTLAAAAARGWAPDAAALALGCRAAALTVARAGSFAALPTGDEIAALIARP
jgi:ribokinase